MSWVRLDDGAPGHRKIVGLSDAAFRLWIVGLTHCNKHLPLYLTNNVLRCDKKAACSGGRMCRNAKPDIAAAWADAANALPAAL